MNPLSGSLKRKSAFFQNGRHFPKKFKMSKNLMLWIIAIYIYIFSFMQIQPTVLKLAFYIKNELTINTINLICPGGKKLIKIYFSFHRFQFFDFQSLGSIATEILSRKWGAAPAWYTDQSNISRRIFNSGQEITFSD